MNLKIIRSPKHQGAIFLKILGSTKDDFLCKIYARKSDNGTLHIANKIKAAMLREDKDIIGAKAQFRGQTDYDPHDIKNQGQDDND